jgi:lipopolysaccharide transport system ATP-binding protein
MSSEIIIKAEQLGKMYQIYKHPSDRLKQMLWRGRKKFYNEYWALNDVSFSITKGQTVGIIGRNGAGKSTLLQMICGTLTPTCGTLEVHGRVAALLELGAGFNPEFTGRENIHLAASILGLSSEQIVERLESILSFASIGDFIDQPVKLYSSGMYARLAFAVAAHVDADILIIDEILAVGDAAFTQRCMRFIHEFKKNGTILFVSHDTGSVLSLCDSAIWLESGTIRESGLPKDLCLNYLAAIESEKEDPNSFKIGGERKTHPEAGTINNDHRHELLVNSELKNVVEIFEFDPDSPWFGRRGATIVRTSLHADDGSQIKMLIGGESIHLEIEVEATSILTRPIIGFFVKNKLGQQIFGDNTYMSYIDCAPPTLAPGDRAVASFHFQMPYLPAGQYAITTAIAEGTEKQSIQLHWCDDALFFQVHSSHISRGLVGIPMLNISIDKV